MNKKSLILSIPMMLAIFLFGGWFLFRNLKTGEESQKPMVVGENLTQKPEDIQSLANVDTSNWKTYRNEEYGFELKYPEEWVATAPSKNIYNEVFSLTSRDTDSKLIGAQNQAGDNMVIHVLGSIREDAHVKNLGGSVKNLEDFLSLDVSQTEMKLIEKIEFGGRSAYIVGVFGLTGHYGIIFETESGVYKIVFEKTNFSMSQGKQVKNKFTDILSDQEIGVLASLKIWKTYRNEEYGFELKYPAEYDLDENNQWPRFFQAGFSNVSSRIYFQVEVTPKDDNESDESFNIYLDHLVASKSSLSGKEANLFILEKGYCDGPGCSPPKVALKVDLGNRFLILVFTGVRNISEDFPQMVVKGFRFLP